MPAASTEIRTWPRVSPGARLALDGGTPRLASSYVATWPSPTRGDDHHLLYAMRGSTRPDPRQRRVHKLERRWQEATGTAHVVACRSASAAVNLALRSLDVGPGDEIICAADAPLTSAVLAASNGAVPVLVDIDPSTLQLDPAAVEAAITPRTRLILGVDRYGTTPDFRALGAISRRNGLQILEDGSQARGALFDGRPVGALGAVSVCAFGDGTNPQLGQGGLLATDDAEVAERARRLILVDDEIADPLAYAELESGPWPAIMSEFDAALAHSQLVHWDDEVAARAVNGARLARRLSEVPGLDVPAAVPGATHVHSSLPLLVQPDELGLPESAAAVIRDTLIDCMMA